MSYSLDSREEKIAFIYETMTGFYSVMRNLQEDYKTYSQNYSKEALELLSKSTDFIDAVDTIRTLDSIRRINDEGIDELTELSRTISLLYHLRVHGKGVKLPTFNTIKDADVIENKNEGTINLSINSWKVYLSEKNEITKVEYGTDKTKAQIITSDGTIGAVIEMVGADYEGKGFAKKLLTAAKLETTEDADLELQNKMLDDGLFYINKEEGWIEKQKYFKRMTPPDFLTIQDYKDVTVKAVYDDSKGELTFTYTAGGKTENLFVIKASNNQKERQWPTKSGNNVFPSEAATSAEKKKIAMKTMPDDGTTPVDYIPGKFPKGNWKITAFEKQAEKNSKRGMIKTNRTSGNVIR